jgi:hypothetical protein
MGVERVMVRLGSSMLEHYVQIARIAFELYPHEAGERGCKGALRWILDHSLMRGEWRVGLCRQPRSPNGCRCVDARSCYCSFVADGSDAGATMGLFMGIAVVRRPRWFPGCLRPC